MTVGRQRYTVESPAIRVDADRRAPNDRAPGQYVAGGAILGTILGAIAAGGKGAVIGGIAGYYGGWTDMLIQRGIEVIQSFTHMPVWMAL